tara:strand:+ start:1999 stop:2385 length:387 start_codon:yes stop_codon:yes gene_type:complete
MKKIFSLLIAMTFLSGCVESMALLGSTTSGAGSTKVAQSAISSTVSYGIKKQTGKSPTGHALAYIKKHNPELKKEKCLNLLEKTNSKTCAAINNNISETGKKIVKVKKSIFDRYKIEDLAKKSGIDRR